MVRYSLQRQRFPVILLHIIQNHPQSVNILLALYGRLVLRLLKICKKKIHQGMEHRIFL